MKNEPTVLDYVKALLTPWKGAPPPIPHEGEEFPAPEETVSEETAVAPIAAGEQPAVVELVSAPPRERVKVRWPLRTLAAVVLALAAQAVLEPPEPALQAGAFLYAAAAAMVIWAMLSAEWSLAPLSDDAPDPMPQQIRLVPVVCGLVLAIIAFLTFGNKTNGVRFTLLDMVLLGAAVFYLWYGVWLHRRSLKEKLRAAAAFLRKGQWTAQLRPFTLLVLLAIGLVVFFRFYRLEQVPNEMFSDQAEKLLDVSDVLDGQYWVFFPRNTGREAFQMYLTAAIAAWLGTGLTFMSLKIGTVLAGLFTLPYIYKLGKEIGNRWVGLLALLLAGIAYWPNVISRIGLRFPLYPLFAAPVLFYLIRGLRTSNRNDFVLSGVALGIGLHGYSPIRIVPFVIVIAIGLYLLHAQSRGKRSGVIVALALLVMMSLFLFVPLLRYIVDNPEMFALRAFSRLTSSEQAYPDSPVKIFFSNLWNASVMFFYDDGEIWVHSIPHRPALDTITAAFFFLGSVLVLARYVRRRHWLDLFLVLSVPLLMMPSILSLAFPGENPALNRASGAIVPVFVIAALGLESFLSTLSSRLPTLWGKALVALFAISLLSTSTWLNYDLVFNQFAKQFAGGAWNTTDIGHIARSFAELTGTEETSYVVPYPYWVDTRLVGMNAGFPTKDYALDRDRIPETVGDGRAKMFIVNKDDQDTLKVLHEVYPSGSERLYEVPLEGKSFWIFLVPAQASQP